LFLYQRIGLPDDHAAGTRLSLRKHTPQPERSVLDDRLKGKMAVMGGHLLQPSLACIFRVSGLGRGGTKPPAAQNEREAEEEFAVHGLLDVISLLNTQRFFSGRAGICKKFVNPTLSLTFLNFDKGGSSQLAGALMPRLKIDVGRSKWRWERRKGLSAPGAATFVTGARRARIPFSDHPFPGQRVFSHRRSLSQQGEPRLVLGKRGGWARCPGVFRWLPLNLRWSTPLP